MCYLQFDSAVVLIMRGFTQVAGGIKVRCGICFECIFLDLPA